MCSSDLWLPTVIGTVAVFLIIAACHLLGEAFDTREDILTLETGRTKFSGGTLMVATGRIPAKAAITVALSSLGVALVLGLAICLITGNWLLMWLGCIGGLSAVIYSTPPIRVSKRGLGELLIAFVYGWLIIVTGYATASGVIPTDSYILCLPLAFSIFNVILLNEFPDYEPDKVTGKRNLVVRFGRENAASLYGLAALLVAASLLVQWGWYRSGSLLYLLAVAPSVLLALVLAWRVSVAGIWKRKDMLEPTCGLGIVLNYLCSVTIAIVAG